MTSTPTPSLRILETAFQACAQSLKSLDALVCERRVPKKPKDALSLAMDTLSRAIQKIEPSVAGQATTVAWLRARLSPGLSRKGAQLHSPQASDIALLVFEAVTELMHQTAKALLERVAQDNTKGAPLPKGWTLALVTAPVWTPEQHWLIASPGTTEGNRAQKQIRALQNLAPSPTFDKYDFFDQAHVCAWLHCQGYRLIRVPTLG